MRRFFTIFAALFAFVGCSQDDVVTPNAPIEKPTYYASFADAVADSRTYLDENFMLLWHNDDRISLFATTYNEEYAFADATGSNSGAFNAVDKDSYVTGNAISTTYAVYPYNAANAISNSEILTIHFPAEQSYAEDSFGRGANTMVAAAQSSSSKLLPFRNAGGYLMLKLYGEGKTVKSIELKGNNEEILSGAATAEAKYGYLPAITMGTEGGKTITLNCEEAVTLGATQAEATVFWMVVPPITFEKGFTITVTDAEGGTFVQATSKEVVIERNEIKSMAALAPNFEGTTEDPEVAPKPANNEIWYTNGSTTEATTPYKTDVFGANIVSNTYDADKECWVIRFDADVTSIRNSAFEGCSSLASVTIPDSVTSIGNFAFRNCSSLENVTIGDRVASIGNYAFSGCSSLTNVTIPDSVTSIGGGAFEKCDSLTSITIPNSVTTIGNNTFSSCRNLKSITIPNSVTKIGNYAFRSCTSLTSVTIPDSVTLIGDYAFINCTSLTSLTIPNSVTSIGKNAFYDCNSLASITIPNSVTAIGEYAFGKCTGELLVNCNIPASTNGIFYCCAFSSVTIGDGVTIIGEMAFYNCCLTSVTIGNSVTTIGDSAFVSCDGFTSVNIPDSVREIGRSAFDNCGNITSVTIGNSVTYIGYAAFAQCKNLASVYCKAITPPSTTLNDYGDCNVFMDNASNRQIYVPKESVEAYKRARGWSNYASYIQSLPYTPTECTALTITADDVCGNDTHTTIYYTAVTNGVDNGEYCSKTITGTCQSDEFPQNTSTTESIERMVSFTYLGQTATTTITQGPFVKSSYTISLNSAWRQSTSVSNPDSSLYDGVYESYGNYNVHSASAWMYIDIVGYDTFTIYVRSYAESNYDYVTVYNLDSTSSAKMTTKGNQQGGTSISSYTPVTFSNIGGGSHRIAIEYKKDSSQNSNSDRGYVIIPKNQ